MRSQQDFEHLSSSTDNPIYKPLFPRETRRVWIREDEGSLHFELEIVSLDAPGDTKDFANNNSYLALSYTWQEYETIAVAVKGEDGQLYPTYVTKSLLAACKYLVRGISTKVPWWIDQLSINQVDESEKMRQIEAMRDIYEHSTEVVIWLGEPTTDTRIAMSLIHNISQVIRKLHRDKEPLEQEDGAIVPKYLPVIMGPYTEDNINRWRVTADLIASRWFSRLWIMQEGTAHPLLSGRAYAVCGDQKIQFFDFLRLYQIMTNLTKWRVDDSLTNELISTGIQSNTSFNGICDFWMFRTMYKTFPLLPLLQQARNFNAADPRDKVLGLAHFATDLKSSTHRLDINYDMTPEQIFINVVIWLIREYANLDFLDCLNYELAKTLPDWVPDWTAEDLHPGFTLYENYNLPPLKPLYSACGVDYLSSLNIQGNIGAAANIRALTISGIRLGAVKPWDAGMKDHYHGNWATLQQNKCPLNQIPLSHVITRTLCLDFRDGTTGGSPAWPCKLRGAYLAPEQPCTKHDGDCLSTFPGIPGLGPQYRSASYKRETFMLKPMDNDMQGVLGLGPKGILEDDEIWVLKGGKLLYLLRPWKMTRDAQIRNLNVTGNTNTPEGVWIERDSIMYRLIGECFVLGLVDGEVHEMLGETPSKPKPQCLSDMDQSFRDIHILHPDLLSHNEGGIADIGDDEYKLGEMQIPQIRLGFLDDAANVEFEGGRLEVFDDESRYWTPHGNEPDAAGGLLEQPVIIEKPFRTYEITYSRDSGYD